MAEKLPRAALMEKVKTLPGGVNTHLPTHQRQDVHLPRQAVFDRGHDETGAAEDDLPLCPLVQLRLALTDAEDTFQQRSLLLVCVHWTLWSREPNTTTTLRGPCRSTCYSSIQLRLYWLIDSECFAMTHMRAVTRD